MATLFIANRNDAVCSDCGKPCEPVWQDNRFDYDGPAGVETHDPGSYWVSDCCEDDVYDKNGGQWKPEIEIY